jgi:hypothetical protein
MKNLLVVLFLFLVAIVGLGFYQGWFHLSTDSTADHKPNVTFTVDEDKIEQDKKTAKEKMQDFGHKAKDKTDDHNDK